MFVYHTQKAESLSC